MEARTRIGMVAATFVACAGLLVAPAASAAERVENASYAGTDFDTSLDANSDGVPAGLMIATGAGGSQVVSRSEWSASQQDCRDGYDFQFELLESAGVTTYSDRSQIYSFALGGWLCVSSSTGAFYGELSGIYTGGTGRFAGATGTYTSKFEGQMLDPAGTIRAVRGSTEGRITTP